MGTSEKNRGEKDLLGFGKNNQLEATYSQKAQKD